MARLIFISPYLKGGKNAKWLRNRTHYFATREGVVIPEKDADTPPTEKQKAYIQRLTKNLPLCCGLLEYEDYKEHSTRMTAAEFIAQAYEQFVAPMDKRENYIDYVANRPGAQQVGGHGLWDANGPVRSLREVEEAVSQHAGNVWTPIVSLRREDAERLGYTDVENWRALVCACVGDIAEAYKIHPDHLKWYAALHTKEKHVHIHMILYSTDPREGYLTVQGIRAVKSAFVTKVYENDRISIYEKQTQYRTRLRENAEERMLELIRAMRSGTLQNERMEQLIEELTQRLPLTKGRKVYGYLLPRLKRIVDEIVDELAKDPRVAEAYEIWQELQEQKCLDYSQNLPERLPLSQQKEFKTVRNMVIQEVLKRSEQDLEAMRHRQVEEQPVQERPQHRLILTRGQGLTCRCTTNLCKGRVQQMVRKRIMESQQTTRRNRRRMYRPTAGCQKEMRCIAHLLLAIRSCRCCTTWAGSSRITARLTVRSMACGSTASAAASSSANASPWDTSRTIMRRYRIHSAEPRHR